MENISYLRISYLLDQRFSNNSIFLPWDLLRAAVREIYAGANRVYQHSPPMGGRKVIQAVVGCIATKIARITIDG
jgi:hypothetical protein